MIPVGGLPAARKRGARMWENLERGIRTHSHWVGALIRYLESGGEPPADLTLDEQHCEIGRWIAEASREYADRDAFERLREVHAAFHACAHKVVALAESGDTHGAFDLMKPDGEFARLSMALILAFDALDEQREVGERG